ncbi:MAG: response regulator [Bacteriovorax sp.]|nr:response regulator [Rhizobacter sp.]
MIVNATDILNARILIVDDQPANVTLLERLLGEAGYTRVTSTLQPTEVRALHRQNHYDVILLDLQMPVMDGFEVMEGLKGDTADSYLPVIVLTAQPAHKLRALQAGAKDFISKPFDLIEVKTRIHNMLEVRLLYRRLENYSEVLERAVLERTADLIASGARFRGLTELASDWYWEQNETGAFTHVSGPVVKMLGINLSGFLSAERDGEVTGWLDAERDELQAKISAREPFLDFGFTHANADGNQRQFRVSGEPMFNAANRFTGYRGMGVETTAVARNRNTGTL